MSDCPMCDAGLPKFVYALDSHDGHGKQVKVYQCCEEMSGFLRAMPSSFHVGDGEISGNIWIEQTYISFSDGWNSYPVLRLRFCPFCGMKRIDWPITLAER